MKLTDWFEARLARTREPWILGEIRISPGYYLTHREEASEDDRLRPVSGAEAFLNLVRFDADGRFRPLRGAPGLRRGWRRGPLSAAALVADLRILYPGALSLLAAWEREGLVPTPFAETARRQTGIYEVTRRLSCADLPGLVEEICARGCLRHPLWQAPELRSGTEEEIPLLCPEACPFFLHRVRSRAAASRQISESP